MDAEPELVNAAAAWAAARSRSLDAELLATVLELRGQHDELAGTHWPSGSAERLLLVTWPAYGPPPPDPEVLGTTLDTFWGYLRATGRMRARSASPAELRKEARRSLPRMAAAYDDPARHSQIRVLGDFGRPELDDEALAIRPGDPAASAREARESAFVQQCLRLRAWVAGGRPVTRAGMLRPAVAREAYQELDLWQWDRREMGIAQAALGLPSQEMPEEADALMAEVSRSYWRSAGDCLALDRLWCPATLVGLVTTTTTTARQGDLPVTDEDWRQMAVMLLLGLALRLDDYTREPLVGVLLIAALERGPVPLDEVREWWWSRCPAPVRDLLAAGWEQRLDRLLFYFEDSGLWRLTDRSLQLTDLGIDFAIAYLNLLDSDAEDSDVLDSGLLDAELLGTRLPHHE